MKLLLVSDMPSEYLWSHYRPELVEGVSLILSAGDLKREYLDFLVTMTAKPLVYVPGNHDRAFVKEPPGGCLCADGCVVTVTPPDGPALRIAGLGGCQGGNPAEPYQYTERAMARRAGKLLCRIRRAGGIDIFLTHAPALGLGDGEDAFHTGFACFHPFIARARPRLHVYGHQHKSYKPMQSMEFRTGDTRHLNAFGYRILDW
ncbi:MAG: metallophosphoesterase [Oscillospiraceae bacterium]|nr:metallophosphoesterase [Oscillospiraceae bacterium]